MMKPQTSPHDLEILSLYLDEQLSPTQRKRLEERLTGNQALSHTLDELRQTRLAYRTMPRVHSPRNFTLTPQMIGSNLPQRVHPAWGFVSAMASFLFILILAGDLLGIFSRPASTANLQQVSEIEAAAPAADNAQEKSLSSIPTSTAVSTETISPQAQEAFKAVAPAANEPSAQATQTALQALAIAASGPVESATPPLEGIYAKEAPSPEVGGPGEVGSSGTLSDTLRLSASTAPAIAENNAQLLESSPTATESREIPPGVAGESEQANTKGIVSSPEIDFRQRILWILEGIFASTAIITGMIVFFQKQKATYDRRRG